MRYLFFLVLILISLSCSAVISERTEGPSDFPAPSSALDSPAIAGEFTGNAALQPAARSDRGLYGNTYHINFGPQPVMIRASVRENRNRSTPFEDAQPANLQRYFDLRATSALAGTGLIGEGEMAYGVLNSFDGNMRPEMYRLGLRNRWRGFNYGADYKSVVRGFTPVVGKVAEQSRDEALVWGEHGVGPFNLRGSLSESWEPIVNIADLRVTRTVATALQIKRPGWAGSFSTSYGLLGQGGAANEETAVVTQSLSTSFRPSEFLLLEPSVSLKEETNQSTGVKIQTPSSGLSFVYSPPKSAFRLSGGTSFSRIFDKEGSTDARMHGTSAALDWRLGKFLGSNDALSVSFSYTRHLDYVFRSNSHGGLSSMLQFKVAGF